MLPERDAQGLFNRLRSGVDIETLLNRIANGNLLLQLAVVPETRYRYTFPYRVNMPRGLLSHDNPYFQSLLYEAASILPSSGQGSSSDQPSSAGFSTSSHSEATKQYETAYLMPYHAAELVEPALASVKPSMWTSACKDDVLMRRLLTAYFFYEYPVVPAFHKDFFLNDMEAQRSDFCSPLLVNTVLAYACVSSPKLVYFSMGLMPLVLLQGHSKPRRVLGAPQPQLHLLRRGPTPLGHGG